MKAVLNLSPLEQLKALLDEHGESLVEVQVTKQEMSSIVKTPADILETVAPKFVEHYRKQLRILGAKRRDAKGMMDTSSQAYFDKVDEFDLAEHNLKNDVPSQLMVVHGGREVPVNVNMKA